MLHPLAAEDSSEPVQLDQVEVSEHRHVVLGFAIEKPADANKSITVTRVVPGGVADRCGLKKRDEILYVDRRLTLDMTHDQITEAFTLGPGESVVLEVRRGKKFLSFTIDTTLAQ